MANITIAALNCQGLGDFQKRRDVFQYLKQKRCDIYFLEDTHFDEKMEKRIRSEWGYQCIFSSYSTQARGVAILFNNTFDFKINQVLKDANGNCLVVNLTTMEKDITLVNIYGPNKDDPNFYEDIMDDIKESGFSNFVIAGDWNLVLNPALDYYNYKHVNNPKAQEKVFEMMTELELTDVWREINPELLRYTWRRNNPVQQSRLDFFLVSDSLLSQIKDTDILPGYRSDHSMIKLVIEFRKENTHRKNYWKLNSKLLKDPKCVQEIHDTINRVKEQYAVPVYNFQTMRHIPHSELQFTICDQTFLDVLLMEIRDTVLRYSVKKKRSEMEREVNLEKEIESLEKKRNKSEEDLRDIMEKKEDLQRIRKSKMEGILLRSKARWAAQGEKVTKYYCNLEKRHFVSKQMYKLECKDGKCLEETEEMLEETKNFYQELYSEKDTLDTSIENYVSSLPCLTDDESQSIEGLISLEEASDALSNMKNGKSPGTSGMTVDFYKFFWKQLGDFVVRSLNEGFLKGKMSTTQREGILVCIPKGDKPRQYLKNWRPISLLNVAYKIGSTCIANRLKQFLPQLVKEDQTGFVPGRYIGDNLRLLYDMIHYLKTKNQPGLLVSIDFEKAFDSVDWSYMNKVLKAFGFGRDIVKWVTSFYTDIKSSVIVNGKPSKGFEIRRGCRQGDPISPYLFILCAEVLACKIREDKDIKGIQIANTDVKISQFADDTSFLLEGDRHSFEKLFQRLQEFASISGLKLNVEKTYNVWLGSKRNSDVQWLPHLNMCWNPPKFKILGLWFTNDTCNIAELNLDDKFQEVKKLFNIWLMRSSTPVGRSVVLKSLILSKLIYLWIMLPNPPDDIIKELQQKCFSFVWDGKRDKIKRTRTVHCLKNGGLNIPEIGTYIKALKLTWLKRFKNDSNAKWKIILQATNPEIEHMDIYGSKLLNPRSANPFWTNVFQAYHNLYDCTELDIAEDVLIEPLFLNPKLKINGNVFNFIPWSNKQITSIKDLIKEDGSFLTIQEFNTKYNINVRALEYLGCVSSIKAYLKKRKIQLSSNRSQLYPKTQSMFIAAPKGATVFYELLLGEIEMSNACQNWEKILEKDVDWTKIFEKNSKIKEIKLRWFQWKICYRILVTNSVLLSMKVTTNNLCNFCQTEKDTIFHYMWKCEHTQTFWVDFERTMKNECLNCDRLTMNPTLVLFGFDGTTKTDSGFDFILLHAKFYVYKCRLNKTKPTMQMFIRELKIIRDVDKYVHRIESSLDKYLLKWMSYNALLD